MKEVETDNDEELQGHTSSPQSEMVLDSWIVG